MGTWTDDELRRIGGVDETTIAPMRADGEVRPPTIVWVVRVGSELYVRAARGANTGWYGVARASRQGRIEVAGSRKDVVIDDADEAVLDQVDDAYREKYGHRYSSIVESITDPEHRATTLRLTPREDA